MLEFVTLKEAKDHLRVDTDAGDEDLQLKIYSASASVYDYIQEVVTRSSTVTEKLLKTLLNCRG